MISLFIDTSLSDVSIALVKEEKLLSLIHEDIPNKHSIYVTKYIDDILKQNNLSPKDVDEIVVVNGPGSFTGIRIGVTIAKTYAYLLSLRIVTITSLLARAIGTEEDYILSTIDAKHDNYYIGLYDNNYNKVTEEFNNKDRVEELIKKYNPILVDNTNKEYDIVKIINYCRHLPSINPHAVNPVYLKLPEAMEKKMLREIVKADPSPYAKYIEYLVEDKVVGYLKYSLIYDRIEIDNILVEETYRNSKIGTKLMSHLIMVAIENRVENITLEVRVSNEVAIHLYKNFGFREVALRKYYYGDEDAILMEKQVM